MPLVRIQHYPTTTQVLIASENISHLAVLELSPAGMNYCRVGAANPELVCGVAWGAVSGKTSGQVVRVVTAGFVSGLVCASNINAGDRVMLASGGRITTLNSITPAGAVSGFVPINLVSGGFASGGVGIGAGPALGNSSGNIISGLTGAVFSSGLFAGTAFNTGRVLGKALASGLGLSAIPVLVTLGA